MKFALSVIALISGQPKKPLFDKGIFSVPKCPSHAKDLAMVANATDSFFTPAVGFAACIVMGYIFPSSTVGAVVLADRTPLPVGEVRPPLLPMLLTLFILL